MNQAVWSMVREIRKILRLICALQVAEHNSLVIGRQFSREKDGIEPATSKTGVAAARVAGKWGKGEAINVSASYTVPYNWQQPDCQASRARLLSRFLPDSRIQACCSAGPLCGRFNFFYR